MTLRINLWSGPRNVSTALMYAFRQRSDTVVWDEPMYGHYLASSGVPHPGRDEILAAVATDPAEILSGMLHAEPVDKVHFFKNMAHHVEGFPDAVLDDFSAVILIRDPADMLPSLHRGLGYVPELFDTGFPSQIGILEHERAAGRSPVVVDARTLQNRPEATLGALCERLGLTFEPAMLRWPAGPKPEDGIWARHWYHRLHTTTRFEPYRSKREPIPDELLPLLDAAAPLYEELAALAIG